MTTPAALPEGVQLTRRQRAAALAAVAVARVLAHLPPRHIRIVLNQLRRRAKPATRGHVQHIRDAVVSVSLRCAGEGCLQRSLAVVVLCRTRGTWPTWCIGVRTEPFSGHAWVEVDDQPVGEPHPAGYYRPLITIPPELTGRR